MYLNNKHCLEKCKRNELFFEKRFLLKPYKKIDNEKTKYHLIEIKESKTKNMFNFLNSTTFFQAMEKIFSYY